MKYIVSSTLTTATWRNSEILGPYDADAIRRLKDGSTATPRTFVQAAARSFEDRHGDGADGARLRLIREHVDELFDGLGVAIEWEERRAYSNRDPSGARRGRLGASVARRRANQ